MISVIHRFRGVLNQCMCKCTSACLQSSVDISSPQDGPQDDGLHTSSLHKGLSSAFHCPVMGWAAESLCSQKCSAHLWAQVHSSNFTALVHSTVRTCTAKLSS